LCLTWRVAALKIWIGCDADSTLGPPMFLAAATAAMARNVT
jgi:hypothetical protein